MLCQCAGVAALAAAGGAQAQPRLLDVPSADATKAIPEFARQADLQIVAPAMQLRGVRTPAVRGVVDVRKALGVLLQDTGLEVASDDGSVIVLKRRAPQSRGLAAGVQRTSAMTRVSYQAAQTGEAGALALESRPPARGDLEEVVVTARRREERLQDVPVAITALDSRTMEVAQVNSAKTLERLIPSLQVNSNSTREGGRYTLRGQGVTLGAGEGVTVYLAEAPLPQFGVGGVGLYYDLENVQVLNGPQGTLFGRNTTGGAILFTPKRPVDRNEGFLEVGYGNYNNREATGMVNYAAVPEKLLFRAAGTIRKRDGFTLDLLDGRHYDDMNYWAFRFSVIARPSERFENYLLVTAMRSETNGSTYVLTDLNPQGSAVRVAPRIVKDFADQLARGPRIIDTDSVPFYLSKSTALIDTATLDLGRGVKLKNIFSFVISQTKQGFDLDGTPAQTTSFINGPNRGNSIALGLSDATYTTNETQLSGKSFGDRLNWVAGGFYQTYGTRVPKVVLSLSFGSPNARRPLDSGASRALFSQGTLNLGGISPMLERTNITAGYRYTWDTKKATSDAFNYVTGACTGQPGFTPNCAINFQNKFSGSSYTLGVDHHLAPSTLVYATLRRGYKSGGFNTSTDPGSAFAAFGPETVNDKEIGLKTDFNAGFPIRLNIAAFSDKYRDIQRNQTVPVVGSSPPRTTSLVLNAALARIQGVEVQTTLRPTPSLTVTGFYSYLDARYRKYIFDTLDLSGTRLPFAPKNKVGASIRYQFPLPEAVGVVSAGATYSYIGNFRGNDVDQPGNIRGDYSTVDATLDWDHVAGSNFSASLFVTNLTDKLYAQQSAVFYNSIGYTSAIYGEPRMYGVRLRYAFGS
jgi:iron complex outermembrane receptor protein